jgi:hypothetical protein
MKHVTRIVGVIIVLVVVLVIAVFVWIDQLAKSGVEGGATYALGVDTRLDDMDVGILSGQVAMADLNVANPGGYKSPHFLELGDGRVGVSLGTLMEDTVVVPELALSDISLNLEHHHGKANYQVIIDNLKRFESGEKPAAQTAEHKGRKKFVIQKVVVRNVRVAVELLPVGGDLTRVPVIIERIELENVGTAGDPVQLAELTSVVLKAILTAVVDRAGEVLPGDIAGELTAGLGQLESLGDVSVQVLGQVTAEVLENVGEAAGQLGEAAQQASEDIAKTVDEGIKKVGEDLGKDLEGFLGQDKKKKDND